ncbi:F-box/LRR-repeat protein 10 [Glycine soja]|uniref:F-box/LRR-repeat protein 10 n=1 Tax=Glycine soja TaxID=3848 RepID=A0A445JKW5_GLYSO|nr:F-box/LRR-repeat protein 10 [Glycine soja]
MILFCCKTSCLRGDLLRPLLLPNPYLTTLKLDCGHLDDSAIGFLLKPSSHHLSLYNGADFNGRLLSSICTRCNHLRSLYLGSIAEKKVRAIHIFDLQELLTLGRSEPCCILTSTTLVVLKLGGLIMNHVSSSVVDLPSLKALHLRRVHFLELRWLLQILSACPLIEDLLIRSLHVTNFSSDEQLKRLPKLNEKMSGGGMNVQSTPRSSGYANETFDEVEVIWRERAWGKNPNTQNLLE